MFFLISFGLYFYTLGGEFLHIDDIAAIVNNQNLRNLGGVVREMRIQSIVYSLLTKVFVMNPLPFHAVSIFLHACNGMLVYLLLREVFSNKISFFSTLLFLVHPINSEVVSWISGSAYLYQAFFWLVILLFFVKFSKSNKIIYLVCSVTTYLIYFVVAGSVWGFVIPLLIATLYYFLLKKPGNRNNFMPIVPFVLIGITYIIRNFVFQISTRTSVLENHYIGLVSEGRLVSMARVIQKTLILLPFPYKLNVVFGYFQETVLNYLVLFATLCLFSLVAFFVYNKNKQYFGLFICIFITIIPVFSPIGVGLGYADRYLYFSSIFFSVLVIKVLFDNEKKFKKKEFLTSILLFILVIFSLRTFVRTLDWHSDETIWKASLSTDAKQNYEACNELGNVYYRKNQPKEALKYYAKALELRPFFPDALYNIGTVFIKGGQFNDAEIYFKKSLDQNPNMYKSYYRLGQVAVYQRDFIKARKYYLTALEINPNFVPAQEELEIISGY